MNRFVLNGYVENTFALCRELLEKKGAEYSEIDDVLSNFRKAGQEMGITPLQAALFGFLKHYSSIRTYIIDRANGIDRERTEPMQGRVADLINYALLIGAAIKEIEDAIPAIRKTGNTSTYFPSSDEDD